ncbi:MAG: 1-deoxy-D-xylulose 5-phosphate reductoisomerase [Planctomycetota bacterium]|jgi:1-deoxy-D-xylulose-5-phosphate reductoisomerase
MPIRRRLIILGSTGSIGENTLIVTKHLAAHADVHFDIIGLAAGTNADRLIQQAQETGATAIALADESCALNVAPSIEIYRGKNAALDLIKAHARRGDLVMGAMVGAAGIAPILSAIEAGCDIALANKETLVAAGAIVTEAARRNGVSILPVDSEHSAILQCLRSGDQSTEVERIVLTASGGPFRRATRETMDCATLADALKHPTWSMGQKVTIDSASMMNKALEMIEAHWLFDLSAERIDVIIHPQSVVHSFVEFIDGSVIAQLSPPDMKLPIQLAMTWPMRAPRSATPLDWKNLRGLEFEPVDHDRFPAVKLAWNAIRAGGSSGAILNGANEAAVEAFVAGRIRFGEIPLLVSGALDAITPTPVPDLAAVFAADSQARKWVAQKLHSAAPVR